MENGNFVKKKNKKINRTKCCFKNDQLKQKREFNIYEKEHAILICGWLFFNQILNICPLTCQNCLRWDFIEENA